MPVTNVELYNSSRWQILWLFFVCLVFAPPVQAAKLSGVLDVESVAQITFDEERGPLDYPSAVFFDSDRDELYVVNGGRGKIIVYGQDYFPRWSIGSGRGVLTPSGVTVMPDGRVFVVQVQNYANPSPRITVLNAAFFPEQDIPLDDISEARGFVPRKVALNADGLMYIAGESYRGVLVLDDEGFFLRKLQPTDKVSELSVSYKPEEKTMEDAAAAEDDPAEQEGYANIPEEFRPRQRERRSTTSSAATGVGPVKVNYVAIDGQGRIYMISAETGKIYVYDSQERFLFSFGTKGGSPGQMSNPRALVVDDERGLMYVADYMRHTILAYNLEGEYLFEAGGRGVNPGWFNFPNDIAINSRGEIVIADLFNKRVQVLDVDYESYDDFYLDKLSVDNSEESTGELERQTEGNVPELESITLDPAPGGPDPDSVKGSDDVEQADESENLPVETDSEEQVEIEILQDFEIPDFSN